MFRPQKIMVAVATIIRVNRPPGAFKMDRIGSTAVGTPSSKTGVHVPCNGARQMENKSKPARTAMKKRFAVAI